MRRLPLLVPLFAAGCAFGPGGPFATVEATLATDPAVPEDRALPNGWVQLSSDYQVSFSLGRAALDSLELRSPAGGAGAAFDPEAPPEGYSNCHGGHCHRFDGALVPYSEIEAELSGGAEPRTVLRFEGVPAIDLLADEEHALGCGGACDLGEEVEVTELAAHASWWSVDGWVRDGRVPSRLGPGAPEVPFTALTFTGPGGVPGPALTLRAPARFAAGRGEPPRVRLRARLDVPLEPLDALDWGRLQRGGGDRIHLGPTANEDVSPRFFEDVSSSALTAEVSRAG